MLGNVASSGWLRVLPTCARLERDCLALRLVRAPSPECALVLAPQVVVTAVVVAAVVVRVVVVESSVRCYYMILFIALVIPSIYLITAKQTSLSIYRILQACASSINCCAIIQRLLLHPI